MIIPITREQVITADNLATVRRFFEYRRKGDGYEYNDTKFQEKATKKYDVVLSSKGNIFAGVLFEICLYRKIVQEVLKCIRNEDSYEKAIDKPVYASNELISKAFSHEITIGKYDEGYDFLLMNYQGGLKIDAKVYVTAIVTDEQSCSRLHLYVDETQYNRNVADIYIQGFILENKTELYFYVAGWKYSHDLIHFPKIKNPAYGVKVPQLNNINKLIEMIYQNDFDSSKYSPF